MAKKAKKAGKMNGPVGSVMSLVVWLTGILVALAVGSGMVAGTLVVMYIPLVVTQVAGWIVIVLTVLGVVLKILDRLG
jgi:hypothetical protein